jgi:hypothetical protein
MENASIAKAEKKIERMSEAVGVSDDGQLWIKESMDPFSDLPRRPVGFPDLITGNSVVQVIKKSKTFAMGASPQDCHIFLDTMDTVDQFYSNPYYSTPDNYGGAIQDTAVGGLNTYARGGLTMRRGAVGSALTGTSTYDFIPLDQKFLDGGSTRVIAKAFEVHNTTNKLNVGGAVTVYRDTGSTPYGQSEAITHFMAGSDSVNITYETQELSRLPETLSDVTLIPGSQQWEAEAGCYCVATMSAQTNNPTDEHYGCVVDIDTSINPSTTIYSNTFAGAAGKPPTLTGKVHLYSPFFLSGAFFTGLPAGTELTVNVIWIIERFVDSSNVDLVVLAQPSPAYDPAAMELYSKTAQRLPHGVKVNMNADGDWIKNIADVLGTFGVPGMPLVKSGVDLWNQFQGGNLPKNESKAEKERMNALESKMDRLGSVVGSPSRSANQPRPQRQQRKQHPDGPMYGPVRPPRQRPLKSKSQAKGKPQKK